MRRLLIVAIATLMGCGGDPTAARSPADATSQPLTNEEYRVAIVPTLEHVKACYDTEADRNPALPDGSILLRLEVAGDGHVSVTVRQSSLGNSTVEGCVVAIYSALQMRAIGKGKTVFHLRKDFKRSER